MDNISGAEAALALKRAVSLKANSDQLQSVAERLVKLDCNSMLMKKVGNHFNDNCVHIDSIDFHRKIH